MPFDTIITTNDNNKLQLDYDRRTHEFDIDDFARTSLATSVRCGNEYGNKYVQMNNDCSKIPKKSQRALLELNNYTRNFHKNISAPLQKLTIWRRTGMVAKEDVDM